MSTLLQNMPLIHPRNGHSHAAPVSLPGESHDILPPEMFARMLYLERKRTERSGRSFVLMLLHSTRLLKTGSAGEAFTRVLDALSSSTRDTDIKGWYEEESTLGVIFTELGAAAGGRSVANALLTKVTGALSSALSITEINEIRLSFHVFPEEWDRSNPDDDTESAMYDHLLHKPPPSRLSRLVKRSMDIVVSFLALFFGLPVFLAIAAAVKLTSRGPVLFRQERLGQYGRKFAFLKFRSMYLNCDQAIHEEYVRGFIANGCHQAREGQAGYKLAADPRVTRIGSFLRKTSLDEIPQFVNVLKGDLSLVGPRPPLPYEVACYQVWHKTRLLAAKPGITGLWQVTGRSRVKFDDMVRMDLQYANSWSIWLDIKILLQTPYAVLSANGAR